MKQIILEETNKEISLNNVSENTPIFAKREGKLMGLLILEEDGWILNKGGAIGAYGHRSTRKKVIAAGKKYGYTFHIEDCDLIVEISKQASY